VIEDEAKLLKMFVCGVSDPGFFTHTIYVASGGFLFNAV
jgi:hypothetical protein